MPLPVRLVQILPLLCAVFHLTPAFPTQTPSAYDDDLSLRVKIPLPGAVSASLGSSISIPCSASLSSASSIPPVVPRVKWTVVSGGVETQILVARGLRVKVNDAYQGRALLNYTSSPDDLSLWLGELRSSDSGHYRCQVQQGLEDASDLVQLKVKGVVFHYRDALGRYAFTFHQAQAACQSIGAEIATAEQLLAAYYDGYEQCDAGWLADRSVRYPIQVPREGCYGDMDGQPGVRNYGTMDSDDLFDVYCYVEQIDGEVFHDAVPQQMSFDEAQSFCRAAGAELATTAQLYLAWSEGLDRCSPGWLSDGSVRYPIRTPRERCGGPQAGVKTLYRFSNQTGFPEPSSLHDAYCFRVLMNIISLNNLPPTGSRKNPTDSPADYVATEPEDIGQDVIILTEEDQELQLNQEAEQVEREAQSALESFPILSSPATEGGMYDPHTTESSFSATSTLGLLQLPNETASPAQLISGSQSPTTLESSTISSNEANGFPHNASSLPNAYKDEDSPQNTSFTAHPSEPESTTGPPESTHAPDSHNHTAPHTQPSLSMRESLTTRGASVASSRVHSHYSGGGINHTVDAAPVTPDTLQVELDEAALEEPVESPREETEPHPPTTPKETSSSLPDDWSGDVPQEIDPDFESASDNSTSVISTSGFTTRLPTSTSAGSATAEVRTLAPGPTLSSGSRRADELGFNIVPTSTQLGESSLSTHEGSGSLENDDTITMGSERKQLNPTASEENLVSEGLGTSESPEESNPSLFPTEFPTAQYKTPGYREYLDASTGAFEEASGEEAGITIAAPREDATVAFKEDHKVIQIAANDTIGPTLDEEPDDVSSTLEEEAKVLYSLEKEVEVVATVEEQPQTFEEGGSSVTPTLEAASETTYAPTEVADINPKFEEDGKPTPTFKEEVSFTPTSEEKDNIALTHEEEAEPAPTIKEEVSFTPTLEEEANIAPTLEELAEPAPTVKEEVSFTPTLGEGANIAPTAEDEVSIPHTLENEANVPPNLKEEVNIAPTPEEEDNIASTSEEETGFTQHPEEDPVVVTTLKGEASLDPTLAPEEEAIQEDFTKFPQFTSTSDWPLLATTAGLQEPLSDVTYGSKPHHSSTAAPDSLSSTRSNTAATKTATTSTTRSWSPTTSTARLPDKTTEAQKVTHLIPPVDQGLVDVEFSLTQPPTLLNLPNERAAVGGAGKASDACEDNTCLNGGTCTDRHGQAQCLCLPTYAGDFCQIDLEQCELGWDKFHGFCYRHFSQRLSWEVAEKHCRMMGAHLVSIMSPEEQTYISSNYKEYQWTGLNDKTIEDDFRWSDGNPLLYENWYRGQPDSYFLSGEDCVVMVWHDDGRWSDVPCNYQLAYTCKKGTSSCGPPPRVRNASLYGKSRQRYETDAVVRYYCAKGFQQRLNPMIRCLSGGRWERPQILCIPEAGFQTEYPEENSEFAVNEVAFEATKETQQYWDIKF
ncbi:brevican core protein-like [Betta splendens]|uniref:Brevican core protein-like n=1 Tax=Betta splendens TaxID=158456 RepID=A0A9W2Y4R2_BETSP|nr:brevican core protein-like [Betta splendens]